MRSDIPKIKYHLMVAIAAAGMFSQPSFARDNDFSQDTTPIVHGEQSLVTSDQMLDISTSNSSALRMEGEQLIRVNKIDKAVVVLAKSVEISPADMDGRILYAEALEKKLSQQTTKNPQLHNLAVKQWFYIAKKGNYMDQKVQGLKHLSNICGSKPRLLETEERFLSRVLLPEDQQVANGKAKSGTVNY
ncbi:hypothetical protein BH10CYA1_BH10CYA1_12850 [soil metagenome]